MTSTFDHPEKVKLGECALIDEIMIGEDTVCGKSFGFRIAPFSHLNLRRVFYVVPFYFLKFNIILFSFLVVIIIDFF